MSLKEDTHKEGKADSNDMEIEDEVVETEL